MGGGLGERLTEAQACVKARGLPTNNRMAPIDPVEWPPPAGYSEILDARSPAEFAEDRVPGAINLPVLTDDERAQVGTVYTQETPFTARKLGAALVSANIARHLAGHLADKPKDYRPLIYCWRGGQRSGSLSLVLGQIGWRVGVVRGGYKSYRAWVADQLKELPQRFTYRLIAGATGSGKTRLLHHLRKVGEQTLDLESLAGHRGSLLGNIGPQPSQKWLESQLVDELTRLDPARPVWLEAESRRIGDRYIPATLWDRMRSAAGIELRVSITGRTHFILDDYAHLIAEPDRVRLLLPRIATRHGVATLTAWREAVDHGEWAAFVESLLVKHYDPGYSASACKQFGGELRPVCVADPRDALQLTRVAAEVAQADW